MGARLMNREHEGVSAANANKTLFTTFCHLVGCCMDKNMKFYNHLSRHTVPDQVRDCFSKSIN